MGAEFPSPIRAYIHAHVIDKRYPAYLQVNTEGSLSTWGGALHHYGLDGLQIGQDATEQLPFLTGLLPADEDGLVLPWIKTAPEGYADVHLIGSDQSTWVILLDATGEASQYCVMQQKINDINLHLEATERTLEKTCGFQNPSWQGLCIHENFIIRWVNPAFAGMLGTTDTEVWIGRDIRTLIAGEACTRFESSTQQVIQGAAACSEGIWPGQRADGQRFWMKAQSFEKTWCGQPSVLMMSLDITEEKRLEAQLQQTQHIFEASISAGELAHDLSSIFTTILGCTELALYHAPLDNAKRQNLRELQTASQQAWELVRHLLTLNEPPSPARDPSSQRVLW